MLAPESDCLYPEVHGPNGGRVLGPPQVTVLRSLVQSPFTEVGEYTYYADPDDPTGFERHNVLYHYGPDRLVIGRYCALARQVRFVMGAAGHRMGLSTFPFPMFGGDWVRHMDLFAQRSTRGDTVVGHDVWLGYGAVVMAGVRIGHGAVVAANAVVSTDVPDYGVVAGNPARLVRRRFSDAEVDRLLCIAWWNWPAALVTRHVRTIMGSDLDALEAAAREGGGPSIGGSDGPVAEEARTL